MPIVGDGTYQSPLRPKYNAKPWVQKHYIVEEGAVELTTTEKIAKKLVEKHDDVIFVSDETPEEAIMRMARTPLKGDKSGDAEKRVAEARKNMSALLASYGFKKPKPKPKPAATGEGTP